MFTTSNAGDCSFMNLSDACCAAILEAIYATIAFSNGGSISGSLSLPVMTRVVGGSSEGKRMEGGMRATAEEVTTTRLTVPDF